MRRTALAATAALTFLAACDAQDGDQTAKPADAAATAVNATEAAVVNSSAAALGEPIGREQALKLMHDRHERMEEIGDAMKLVSRELRSESPEPGRLRGGASTIARFAPQVSGWFPPGSGPDIGKTEAKAEIWQTPADFAAKTNEFQQAALAFNAAADRGDLAIVRAAHANLGKTCKACHDLYREEH